MELVGGGVLRGRSRARKDRCGCLKWVVTLAQSHAGFRAPASSGVDGGCCPARPALGCGPRFDVRCGRCSQRQGHRLGPHVALARGTEADQAGRIAFFTSCGMRPWRPDLQTLEMVGDTREVLLATAPAR